MQILLERKYISDALDVCKTLSSSEPIATPIIAKPIATTIPANELLMNEHFGSWLSRVKPDEISLEENEQSRTKFSVFNASKEDFRLFRCSDSGCAAGVIISDDSDVESNDVESSDVELDYVSGGLGAVIECKIYKQIAQNLIIAEMHNVAAEMGYQLVTQKKVLFDNLTIFGLLVSYHKERALIYKLDLDFKKSCVSIWKSNGRCSITEGVNYLFGALLEKKTN